MKIVNFFRSKRVRVPTLLLLLLLFSTTVLLAEHGFTYTTPVTPMELPVEIEIELSPAGSLKQAALWKELHQLLENPYDPVERRPGFGVAMPELNTYNLEYNFLTGQPLRLRTSDGEVSWDNPGPLFDREEVVPTDDYSTPTQVRTVVGHLIACPNDPPYEAADIPADFCASVENPEGESIVDSVPGSSLVIYNPDNNPDIPPHGTLIAVEAYFDGMLHELEGPEDGESWTGEYEEIVELEAPVNEENFFREEDDARGLGPLRDQPRGRDAAEILGKALFWDMQIGSDGVQACGSCHFHAGADNRERNQLNPGTLGGDNTLQVAQPNESVEASDFPFHLLADPEVGGEETDCGFDPLDPCNSPEVVHDANDVMSSMGVSEFKQFVDIPAIGTFIDPGNGVPVLPPDEGADLVDPIVGADGLRRVEPRNTPTFHGAAFNFDNFWDGRARFNFNGGSVFGPSDPYFHIYWDGDNGLEGATNGHVNPEMAEEDPDAAAQPVRIKFSSLASQAVGPPLSDFEMSFRGRNWAKIGKKMLQEDVTPLANQLVAVDDSRLGVYSNQGGALCDSLPGRRTTAPGKPGLCITYQEMIRLSFPPEFWGNDAEHLDGFSCDDPFDSYCLAIADGAADEEDTNQFTQTEANFSTFFGLSIQAYEQLTIPDDTPADKFFDANPNAGHAVGEPGDQAVLFPTLIPDLLDNGQLDGSVADNPDAGCLTLIPDDPATPEYDGFGPDEVFGFDVFAGSNMTAGLCGDAEARTGQAGIDRNPVHTITTEDNEIRDVQVGSNPFTRSAKCMLCHLGPEQTDHSINISHGVLKNNAEFEYPTPPSVTDPDAIFTAEVDGPFAGLHILPAPEPSGSSMTVPGLILSEEVTEGAAQDAVEVEPRNFATFDDPMTPWDDRVIGQPENFAFGDQGVYNIGLRPNAEDIGRGGDDAFAWPLSLATLTLMNIGGQDYVPCDGPNDDCEMQNFDANNIGGDEDSGLQGFEVTGDGALFPGTTYDLQSVNPGYERDPIFPLLPDYMVPWIHSLPAGELHPQIDEMAGMVPNTITPVNGGPGIEFPEIIFGADFHCALYDPSQFGSGPPNFGWGPPASDPNNPNVVCPQNQSGVAGNFQFPSQGTWPVPNRVLRNGAFKAPPLRNVELTGPYFHTGSYLTLRQVIDFYMRGGDFPVANADSRDPNIMDLDNQAFAFGTTKAIGAGIDGIIGTADNLPSTTVIDHTFLDDGLILQGTFADGLPDTAFLYDEYPDSDHPYTPEPAFPSREAALDDAEEALVKFLIALTDSRVKYERAPFDHPEIFVPIDGAAPENTGGPAQLVSLSGVDCTGAAVVDPNNRCFRHIPAVGFGGIANGVEPFLGISSTPLAGPNNDHFDH